MNPELKQRLAWFSPLRFDGSGFGAIVRTTEMIAVDVGLILLGSRMGIECGGPLAIGTLILMGFQFATVENHSVQPTRDWRYKWNLKQQNGSRVVEHTIEPEHHEADGHHEGDHDGHH